MPAEARLAFEDDGPASAWAGVTARTRFYIGARSGPYYLEAARPLCAAMPDASIEIIPRLGHDAAAGAGAALVSSLSEFLS